MLQSIHVNMKVYCVCLNSTNLIHYLHTLASPLLTQTHAQCVYLFYTLQDSNLNPIFQVLSDVLYIFF